MDHRLKSMYGNHKPAPQPPVKPELTPEEKQKAAARVLGGMKVHGSHVKQVMIGEDLVDVPKVEYVKLLDEQLRDARNRLRIMEDRYNRLLNSHNRAVNEINKMSRDMQSLKKELDGKVNLR